MNGHNRVGIRVYLMPQGSKLRPAGHQCAYKLHVRAGDQKFKASHQQATERRIFHFLSNQTYVLSCQHHTTVICFSVLKLMSCVQNSWMAVFVAAMMFTVVTSDRYNLTHILHVYTLPFFLTWIILFLNITFPSALQTAQSFLQKGDKKAAKDKGYI